tara:strand:+ start:298 stop:510 length:213 start_codon:yes stop_codon:yes gene_type:complete
MTHIELVTGKKIIVREALYEIAKVRGPISRLTKISSHKIWSSENGCYVIGLVEQEILLTQDMVVYMYEEE